MSQESTAVAAPIAAPTTKDGLFFLTILMNMKNKPEVDWTLVAAEAGLKNAKVASTRFGQMKKRFTGEGPSASAPSTPTASFNSTRTVANTPSPTKKIKKEIRSGSNVSSGRVRKTPVKGIGMAGGMNRGSGKVRAKLGEENKCEEIVDGFIGRLEKWKDEDYIGEI